ncbi:MAG: PAQR family membrane homeostasis protein TrhA [Acidimicrobiales bacterium]
MPDPASASANQHTDAVGRPTHRPRLRGRLHQAAIPVALLGLWWLVATAPNSTARLAAWVYGLAGVSLYTVSSSYHVFARDGRAHELMQRADHATIYVLIAGSFTPICLLGLSGPLRYGLLALVWGGAVAGICIKVFAFTRAGVVGSALYLVLGWLGIAAIPVLIAHPLIGGLILAAGVLYTVGAVLFATGHPRWNSRWYGFHEVWHTFGLAAGVLLFAANLLLISKG